MNELSRKRQELARQLVEREVYYCVSNLMYGINKIMWDCRGFKDAFGDYPDDLLALYQQDDWETPGRHFVEEDADLSQLEEIADKYGYWSDVLEEIPNRLTPYTVTLYGEEQGEFDFECWAENQEHAIEQAKNADPDCTFITVEEGSFDFDDWQCVQPDAVKLLREKIAALVDAEARGWQEVCDEYGLDPETHEVYEHWLVSSWLARKLEAEGEVVGEFAGLTIWGRTTTGQAICMDGVIETITAETYPEEWNGSSNPV